MVVSYWQCHECDRYFADAEGLNEITLTDIVFAKSAPEIIEGNNQVITAGEKKELTLTFNAVFAEFIRVEIDGKTLDGKKLYGKGRSTIVTLKADDVSILFDGKRTVGIVS